MKKGLIGKKLGMTQVYTESGVLVPVTAIELGPCKVLEVRTQKKNSYSAIQLGFGTRKAKNVSKAVIGNVVTKEDKEQALKENKEKFEKKLFTIPAIVREIRLDSDPEQNIGDSLTVDMFAAKEYVDVHGRTKGRGFAGVVKRWNFGGGRASHGGAWVRRTGSIGMCAAPGKVYKGRKMPGHMGNVNRTVQNLEVVEVRPELNLMLVKGAIPGPNGGFVIVNNAVKK